MTSAMACLAITAAISMAASTKGIDFLQTKICLDPSKVHFYIAIDYHYQSLVFTLRLNMARRSKKQSDAAAAELPLEERVEAFYGNLVKKHGLSTSDASFQTLVYFRKAEPKFDTNLISKFVSKILDRSI